MRINELQCPYYLYTQYCITWKHLNSDLQDLDLMLPCHLALGLLVSLLTEVLMQFGPGFDACENNASFHKLFVCVFRYKDDCQDWNDPNSQCHPWSQSRLTCNILTFWRCSAMYVHRLSGLWRSIFLYSGAISHSSLNLHGLTCFSLKTSLAMHHVHVSMCMMCVFCGFYTLRHWEPIYHWPIVKHYPRTHWQIQGALSLLHVPRTHWQIQEALSLLHVHVYTIGTRSAKEISEHFRFFKTVIYC